MNLVVASAQVELQEYSCFGQLVKELIDNGDGAYASNEKRLMIASITLSTSISPSGSSISDFYKCG